MTYRLAVLTDIVQLSSTRWTRLGSVVGSKLRSIGINGVDDRVEMALDFDVATTGHQHR